MNFVGTRFTVLLACLMMPVIVSAECAYYYCNSTYIETLYTNNNASGLVYVYTTDTESLMTQCSAFQGNSFVLTLDTEGGRAIYATLLTAVSTGRRIDIVSAPNVANCGIKYVRFRQE